MSRYFLLLAVCITTLYGCSTPLPATVEFSYQQAKPVEDWELSLAKTGLVEVIPLFTGEIEVDKSLLINLDELPEQTDEKRWVPVMSYLVRHPAGHLVLLDTGFDSSFARSGHGNFGGLANLVNITRQKPGFDTVGLLQSLHVNPTDLTMVILSHLHPDHSSGLPDFPNTTRVVAGAKATENYQSMWYVPHQHFKNIEHIETIAFSTTINGGPGPALDLFGDGSLFVVSTPGHAPGNLSFLARTKNGLVLLTCDASHTSHGLINSVAPGKVIDRTVANNTIHRLNSFVTSHGINFKAGHDATDWDLSVGIQAPL